jgi:hypothetical protein
MKTVNVKVKPWTQSSGKTFQFTLYIYHLLVYYSFFSLQLLDHIPLKEGSSSRIAETK